MTVAMLHCNMSQFGTHFHITMMNPNQGLLIIVIPEKRIELVIRFSGLTIPLDN